MLERRRRSLGCYCCVGKKALICVEEERITDRWNKDGYWNIKVPATLDLLHMHEDAAYLR